MRLAGQADWPRLSHLPVGSRWVLATTNLFATTPNPSLERTRVGEAGGAQGMTSALAAKALTDTVFDGEKLTRPVTSSFAQWAYLGALLSYVLLAAIWLLHALRHRARH
jgi:hypothetical protein